MNRKDSELGKHPDDFELYQLGLFDDVDGGFQGQQELLVRGKDVLKEE